MNSKGSNHRNLEINPSPPYWIPLMTSICGKYDTLTHASPVVSVSSLQTAPTGAKLKMLPSAPTARQTS